MTELGWVARRRKRTVAQQRESVEWRGLSGRLAAQGYAETELAYYVETGGTNFRRWRRWQIVAVLFGVIGTIAAAATLPAEWSTALHGLGWLRAVPVAIATLANGLLASFSYQSEFVRQATTADALRGEIALFITSSTPYGKQEADDVAAFVSNVHAIVSTEHGRWSDEMRAGAKKTIQEVG